MASDKLFHLKKERNARELARRKAKRSPYDSVLIVCEGEKTEVNYFKGLIKNHRLNSTNIEVCHSTGSAPIDVVNYAIILAKSRPYLDRVICVFDRDEHSTFNQAVEKIKILNSKNNKSFFVATTSTPCFEIWLLLHFQYTTKQYHKNEKCSACGNLINELKNHIKDYKKNNRDLYEKLPDSLRNEAIKNAEKLTKENIISKSFNPSTNVHEVVKYLISINSEHTQ